MSGAEGFKTYAIEAADPMARIAAEAFGELEDAMAEALSSGMAKGALAWIGLEDAGVRIAWGGDSSAHGRMEKASAEAKAAAILSQSPARLRAALSAEVGEEAVKGMIANGLTLAAEDSKAGWQPKPAVHTIDLAGGSVSAKPWTAGRILGRAVSASISGAVRPMGPEDPNAPEWRTDSRTDRPIAGGGATDVRTREGIETCRAWGPMEALMRNCAGQLAACLMVGGMGIRLRSIETFGEEDGGWRDWEGDPAEMIGGDPMAKAMADAISRGGPG